MRRPPILAPILALVCTMACTGGSSRQSEADIAQAAAEAILAARAGSAERPVLPPEHWDFVFEELAWIGDQVPPCTSVEQVKRQKNAYRFRLVCGGEDLYLRVTVTGGRVESAFFWAAHLEPGGQTRAAIDELARLTRVGGVASTAAVWSPEVDPDQLLEELPKLRERGACSVGKRSLGGRQHAMYIFDCEHGAALVGAAVQPDGRISDVDVNDSVVAQWAPEAPQWIPPQWFW